MDLAYDLVGSVLYAAGIVCFVNPAEYGSGRDVGVAILLNYLWGLPTVQTIVLNYPAVNFVVPVSGKIIDLKNGEITGDQQFDGGPGHGKICTCLCG